LSIYHDNRAPWLSRHVLLVHLLLPTLDSHQCHLGNERMSLTLWNSGALAMQPVSGKARWTGIVIINRFLRRSEKTFRCLYLLQVISHHDRDACRRFDFLHHHKTQRWCLSVKS
jgi:hypothetical protein